MDGIVVEMHSTGDERKRHAKMTPRKAFYHNGFQVYGATTRYLTAQLRPSYQEGYREEE